MSTPGTALPEFGAFAENEGLFLWVNTSGRPCKGPRGGCEGRNDVRATLDEWVIQGLPRTGWSYCRHRCHCVLLPLIPFGLSLDRSLDTGGGITPERSIAAPGLWDPEKPFTEQPRMDPAELEEVLAGLPIVGAMRDEVDGLMQRFREGGLSLEQLLALLDDVLFLRATN